MSSQKVIGGSFIGKMSMSSIAAARKQNSTIQISPMTKPLKGPRDELPLSIEREKEIKDKVVKRMAVPKMAISALMTLQLT